MHKAVERLRRLPVARWWRFDADRWAQKRAKGFWRFVLWNGVVCFGIPFAIFQTAHYYWFLRRLVALGVFSEGDVPGQFQVFAPIGILICLLLGGGVAALLWMTGEWQFKVKTKSLPRRSAARSSPARRLLVIGGVAALIALVTSSLPWLESSSDRIRQVTMDSLVKRATARSNQFYERTGRLRQVARNPDLSSIITERALAESVLKDSEQWRNSWDYGNGVHFANIVLGRISLRQGEIEGAKRYLLAAGRTPGSPRLNDYGPDMTLAEEMLRRGQRDVVLEYLQLCTAFWHNRGKSPLPNWMAIVRDGGIPRFGCLSGLSCTRSSPQGSGT